MNTQDYFRFFRSMNNGIFFNSNVISSSNFCMPNIFFSKHLNVIRLNMGIDAIQNKNIEWI